MNAAKLAPLFANEDKAIEFVESLMWPDGPVCPHCGGFEKAYKIKANPEKKIRPGLWKCGYCRKQFTVRVGSIFEDSKIPMKTWLFVISQMCSAKKGVSACQIQRMTGLSYKASWFACHRLRLAMTQEPLVGKLSGIVEVDETYVGGKRKNKLKKQGKPGRGAVGKVQVSTLVERGGDVRSFVMPNAEKGYLQALVRLNVDKVETAHIMTDEHASYVGLDKYFDSHQSVNHSKKEYVRGIIHTNFAESYHSLLKRSIFGTHHHMSAKHLPRYLREREFHWNRRKATDGERTMDAIRGAKGKRLMYNRPLQN